MEWWNGGVVGVGVGSDHAVNTFVPWVLWRVKVYFLRAFPVRRSFSGGGVVKIFCCDGCDGCGCCVCCWGFAVVTQWSPSCLRG